MIVPKTLAALVAALASIATGSMATANFTSHAYFDDSDCAGTPSMIQLLELTTCVSSTTCDEYGYGDADNFVDYGLVSCVEDPVQHADDLFGDVDYLVISAYNDDSCTNYDHTSVYRANGDCLLFDENTSMSIELYANGSVLYNEFDTPNCEGDETSVIISSSLISESACASMTVFNGEIIAIFSTSSSVAVSP